jgi:choline dehydrogenase-like flavoprotein
MSEAVGSRGPTEAVAAGGGAAGAGDGAAGEIAVANPATGETIATVPALGAAEVAPGRRRATDPDGQLHDVPGVWIGDASAFPTASGMNPMVTIMALARRTAEVIAASA